MTILYNIIILILFYLDVIDFGDATPQLMSKITEVKPQKPTSNWVNNIINRYNLTYKPTNRYIEFYNFGIDYNMMDLEFNGLVIGTGPNVTVLEGQYVVLYDAADGLSHVPTCSLCDCNFNNSYTCYGENGDREGADSECWCNDAIYIACGNSGNMEECCPITGCSTSDSVTDCCDTYNESIDFFSQQFGSTINDGCYKCYFNDSMTIADWSISMRDNVRNYEVDSVVYDSDTWILADEGYAYELLILDSTLDNNNGDNWGQICSMHGTPGSYPVYKSSILC